MSYQTILNILEGLIIIVISFAYYKTCKLLQAQISSISKWYSEDKNELTGWRMRGGYSKQQLADMKNHILTVVGRDLNEMQVISLIIAWRDESIEVHGKENEFIDQYIKEHKW